MEPTKNSLSEKYTNGDSLSSGMQSPTSSSGDTISSRTFAAAAPSFNNAAPEDADYQTHVFTSTYTADVSGVCSAMYELGGMTIIHDPSGCNSTYSTHDEPRWFDSDSLMFVSGLDEITAVLGDDSVLIDDVAKAAADLKPRFITLCGGSIPHITAFDYKAVAKLIEKRTGIPTIPVVTNGNRSYIAGVSAALTAWVKRFGNPEDNPWRDLGEDELPYFSVNLLGVTPLDFSVNGNAEALRETFHISTHFGPLNCCAAMGEDFESMQDIYSGTINVVVSSAGRRLAKYMEQTEGIPYVEGLPIGKDMTNALYQKIHAIYHHKLNQMMLANEANASDSAEEPSADATSREEIALRAACKNIWAKNPEHPRWDLPADQILIIGEEIFAQSLAAAINCLEPALRQNRQAYAIWPDMDRGYPESLLLKAVSKSRYIIADPLYKNIPHDEEQNSFIDFPHEAYSGRIFREQIPVFAGKDFQVETLFQQLSK